MKAGKRKRISLFLALCMLLNVTAVPTWAGQKETVSTKDNTVKTATSSDAQVQEEEKGDEEEVLKKTVEEEEKDEETIQTIEAEAIVVSDEDISSDLPDNDELFAGYVEKLFYNEGISTYANWGEERLEGTDRQVYDILKTAVMEIAGGTRKSTVITIPLKTLSGVRTEWTSADAGVDIGYPLSNEAMQAIMLKVVDINKVLSYLMVDCPYELYWYKKTGTAGEEYRGTRMNGPSFSYGPGSGKVTISGELTFSMAVVNAYQGNAEYTMDTQKAASVQAAVKNAKAIVTKHANKADADKLRAYMEEICSLVSYNREASESDYVEKYGYGDPWQLIYVFDGNKGTNVVCEGYAKAFQYLCDLSSFTGDVTCYTVNGMMAGGTGAGRHMWNIVTLEGKNYLVDVTNCDSETVGAPDKLFLAGATGSINSGYTFSGVGVKYVYDNDMQDMYGDILTLAPSSYKPKIDPEIKTLPSPTAVYGQKLNEVKIDNPSGNTQGTWTWQNPEEEVGNAGSKRFKADFTPNDQDTYRAVAGKDITVIVSRKAVKDPQITLEKDSYDYTGKPITPKVTVIDSETNSIIPESEYAVSYKNNTDIGTASLSVHNKAEGNYDLPEETSKTFTIEKVNLSNAEFTLAIPESGYVYDKTEKRPSVTAVIDGVTLNSSWYKVSYAQNIQAGDSAQAIIEAKNTEFCTGTASKTFTIARRPITLTAKAEDKIYDGKPDTAVTVETEGTPIIEGDEVKLDKVTALFTDITPGTDKDVTVTASLTGKDAGNYEVKPTTVKAAIHAYDPKEVKEAIEKAEAAKEGVQGIDKQASSVTQGIRFVSTAQLKAMNDAIEKAKTAIAVPVTAEQAEVLAAELAKATETFINAIQTGTYKSSSGGSSGGGGGGGGGGGSRGTTSSRTNSTSGPGSSQGTVSFDSRKGQVNSVTGIVAGTTNGAAGDGYSHWQQGNLWDNSSWKLQYADGSYAAGAMVTDAAGNTYEQVAWEMINGSWYAFGADAIAKNSWVLDVGTGRWYYVDISSGMKTGWIALNGLWYYLNSDTTGALQKPFGAMYQNEMTPDGYFVNADGSWNGVPKN